MIMSAAETITSPMTCRPEALAFAPLKKIGRWYRRRRDLKEARAAFMHTVYLEDRILDDMGVTREEVRWAASLPLNENAALALRVCAAKRRVLR